MSKQPERQAGEQQGRQGPAGEAKQGEETSRRKIGLLSDDQPGMVAPGGVNERDHGAADDAPSAGGTLDFDDGGDMVHPRGKTTAAGRAWDEKNPSDAGDLGSPDVGMSDRNGPSDPDAKRGR